MKRKYLIAIASAALWSATAFALPSFQEVESTVKAGDYPKAESMMQEVVTAKPQSAKAHYVYAELLAHDAKFADAASQARRAREIDPSLSFTNDPDKFRSFEHELQVQQAGGRPAPAQSNTGMAPAPVREPASSGLPGWVWGLGLALLAVVIWRAMSRNSAMAPGGATGYTMAPGAPQPGYGPGYGGGVNPGYGPGYGQAPGGGMLRTGLAAAGGVAAGMLAEKWLEGRHEGNVDNGGGGYGGGYDNSSADAARELENRPIDFGSGNDWDSGGGGGGGDNFTPSGGGDDGGW